jgi:hypothetical protein
MCNSALALNYFSYTALAFQGTRIYSPHSLRNEAEPAGAINTDEPLTTINLNERSTMAARKFTGKAAGSLTPALITLHRQLRMLLRPV